MNERFMIPIGIAIGAGLMYVLDPEHGRRRRARMRDRVVSSWSKSNHLLQMAQRDASQRAQGLVAETQAMIRSEPVPDEVLAQRVRTRLGRFAAHPRALEIRAEDGKIFVSGPILRQEVDTVLNAIQTTRGVVDVEPSLEIHDSPENVPALQGGRQPTGELPDLMQENWAPATRVLGTIAGGGMILAGSRMRGPAKAGVLASGAALAARSITNLEVSKIVGLTEDEEAIKIRKAININASPEEIFRLWANPENYPRFMEHVREVRKTGEGQYHWTVDAPGGAVVEWDAVITHYEPNKKIGWETVHDTPVPQSGFTRLDENEDGSTRLDVQMTYNPPGGLIGHTVASIFGQDPKNQMDDDLVRFQSLMEAGKTTAKGREITLDELVADVNRGEQPSPSSEDH